MDTYLPSTFTSASYKLHPALCLRDTPGGVFQPTPVQTSEPITSSWHSNSLKKRKFTWDVSTHRIRVWESKMWTQLILPVETLIILEVQVKGSPGCWRHWVLTGCWLGTAGYWCGRGPHWGASPAGEAPSELSTGPLCTPLHYIRKMRVGWTLPRPPVGEGWGQPTDAFWKELIQLHPSVKMYEHLQHVRYLLLKTECLLHSNIYKADALMK